MFRRGFTLVELLVVIVVIGVLVALLVPAIMAARRTARSTICLGKLKDIGVAAQVYAQEHNECLPPSSHSALTQRLKPWGYTLGRYLGYSPYKGPGPEWDALFNGPYRCPEDPRRDRWSYGKNVWFELTPGETGEVTGVARGPTYPDLNHIRHPKSTILFAELESGSMGGDHIMAHFWYLGGQPEVDANRHGSTSNYLFVDGHAEPLAFESTFNPTAGIDLWDPGKAK